MHANRPLSFAFYLEMPRKRTCGEYRSVSKDIASEAIGEMAIYRGRKQNKFQGFDSRSGPEVTEAEAALWNVCKKGWPIIVCDWTVCFTPQITYPACFEKVHTLALLGFCVRVTFCVQC